MAATTLVRLLVRTFTSAPCLGSGPFSRRVFNACFCHTHTHLWADRSSKLTAVGFEPTQLSLVELKSTPLDNSGKLSYISRVAFIVSEYVQLRRAESDMTLPRPDLSCFRRIIWQNCSRQAELACLSMFHCGNPPRWLLRGSLFVQMLPDPPSLGDVEQAQIG